MENPQLASRVSRAYEKKEDRRRDSRIRRLLLLLLLFLLLLFGMVLAYLAMYGNLSDIFNPTSMRPLFSVYGFDRPLAVSTDKNGTIYASDSGNARFLIFDSQGQFVKMIIGKKKPDRFYGVIGSYYDEKDRKLYIADFRMRVINVFNQASKRIARWPANSFSKSFGPLGFSPFGITGYRDKLYITSNDGIYVFSKRGKMLKKWTGRGKELGQWDYPVSIAIGKDGTMYIADQLNRRVVAMDQKGAIKWSLGGSDQAGKSSSFFGLPRGIALDDEGRVFVSDTFHQEIVVFTASGKLVGRIGSRGVEDGKLNFPEGIAFRPGGVIYIADRENNRIQAWRVNDVRKPDREMLKRYQKYFQQPKG